MANRNPYGQYQLNQLQRRQSTRQQSPYMNNQQPTGTGYQNPYEVPQYSPTAGLPEQNTLPYTESLSGPNVNNPYLQGAGLGNPFAGSGYLSLIHI